MPNHPLKTHYRRKGPLPFALCGKRPKTFVLLNASCVVCQAKKAGVWNPAWVKARWPFGP